MRIGSWVRAHPILAVAGSVSAAAVLGTWWASPLVFLALLGLALVAWIPRIGPAILSRIGWQALPIIGSFRGIKASGAIITAAVLIAIAGAIVGPRPPARAASADIAGTEGRAAQISRATTTVLTAAPSASSQPQLSSAVAAAPAASSAPPSTPTQNQTGTPTPTLAPVTTASAAPASAAPTPSTPPPARAPSPSPAPAQATSAPVVGPQLVITRLNFDGAVPSTEADEFVEITNRGGSDQRMNGWRIVSVRGGQTYSFPAGATIGAGQTCRVYTNQVHPEWCGLNWGRGSAMWNNTGDRANLVAPDGTIVSTVGYGTYR